MIQYFDIDNELFRIAITQSPILIFITDHVGKAIYANQPSLAMMGGTESEIIGKNIADIMVERNYSTSTILKAIETKQVVQDIVIFKGLRTCLSTTIPYFDDQDNLKYTMTYTYSAEQIEFFNDMLMTTLRKKELSEEVTKYLLHRSQPLYYECQSMNELILSCNHVAMTDTTVLLLGETGTGKEAIAHHIHFSSRRKDGPFIPINCTAIPKELFESELFGYEKGSFTGANTKGKRGIIELSNHGTLFLDEIGELSLSMQTKLLRVIETKKIQPIGGAEEKPVDMRIIAATNKDLKKMVLEGNFREDLYYRLNIIPLTIPPLRERGDDLRLIAQKYVDSYNDKYAYQRRLSKRAFKVLERYPWPGNVRELRNIIERGVLMAKSDLLTHEFDFLIQEEPKTFFPEDATSKEIVPLKEWLSEKEKDYLKQALAQCSGNVAQLAKKLNIHRSTCYRKLVEYSLLVEKE